MRLPVKFIVVFLDLTKAIGFYPVGKIKLLPLEISLIFLPLGTLPVREMDGYGNQRLHSVLNEVHSYLGP